MGLLDWLLQPASSAGKNIFTQITTPPPTSQAARVFSPTPSTPTVTPSAGASQAVTAGTPQKPNTSILPEGGISMEVYHKAADIAATIRRGIPIVSQRLQAIPIVGKPLAVITPLTSESVARTIEAGGMIPGGVETIAKKPTIIPAAVATGVSQLVTGTIESAQKEPAQFVSDIATGALLGYGAAKAIRVMPIPKLAEVKIPTTAGTAVKPVYETVYRGLAVAERPVIGMSEIPSARALPIIGQIRPTIGAPRAIGIEVGRILPGYFPQTALETRVISPRVMQSLGIAPTEIEKLSVGRGLIDITQRQKSMFIRELPAETKTLPKEGVSVVKDVLRENKADVEKIAGSYAAQSQMMPEHVRVPGDIDLYLKVNEAKAQSLTKQMLSRLKAEGIDAKIDPESPTRIVTRGEHKEWVHAVELHYTGEVPTAETAIVGSPKVGDIRYGYQVEQAPVIVEGFKTMRLSEQGIRKVTGSLEWRPSEFKSDEVAPGLKLSPAGHRLKDITDAYFVQKTLIASKKASPIGRIFEAGKIRRGEILLERWKELYPEAGWEAPATITEEFTIKGVSPAVKMFDITKISKDIPKTTSVITSKYVAEAEASRTAFTSPSRSFERQISPSRISSVISPERISKITSQYVSPKPSTRAVSPSVSRIPSRIPSKAPTYKFPSRVLSRISSGTPSGTPPSVVPSVVPSKIPSPSPYIPVSPYVSPYKTPTKILFPTVLRQPIIYKPRSETKKKGLKPKQPLKEYYMYGEKAAIASARRMLGIK